MGGGHPWLVAVRGHSWPIVVRGLWHWWWVFAISGGGWASPSLVGILASWASLFDSRRRCGTPALTVSVPHQPVAGGVVGIESG